MSYERQRMNGGADRGPGREDLQPIAWRPREAAEGTPCCDLHLYKEIRLGPTYGRDRAAQVRKDLTSPRSSSLAPATCLRASRTPGSCEPLSPGTGYMHARPPMVARAATRAMSWLTLLGSSRISNRSDRRGHGGIVGRSARGRRSRGRLGSLHRAVPPPHLRCDPSLYHRARRCNGCVRPG